MFTPPSVWKTMPELSMCRSAPLSPRNAGGKRFSACVNLDFSGLLAVRRRGLRNGNWSRLSLVDRGLFRCALWVARVRGRIGSWRLLVRVLGVVLRLLESRSMRIWAAGRARAEELMRRFEGGRLFDWAPQVRGWLVDRGFVFYLGLSEFYVP